MNLIWTASEKKFVEDNAGVMKDARIAEELSKTTGRKVSMQSTRKQRQKMGLRKCCGRGVCRLVPDDTQGE